MKKRLLAWLLAVVMVIGLLPAVALADTAEGGTAATGTESSDSVILNHDNNTVTIGGTTYSLSLGQGTLKSNGSLGYWLDSVNRGFIPGDTDRVNEFRYYLFLYDRTNRVEATQTVYERFWEVCEMTDATVTVNGQSDATGVTLGEIAYYSGDYKYYKYIPVSVTGAWSGMVSVAVSYKDTTDNTTCTIKASFQFTAASELTLDADSNSYPISINNAQSNESYFYYINLGEEKTVTVSGALANDPVGRLVLAQTEEGMGENMLWWRWNDTSSTNQSNHTITADKLLLRITASKTEIISGTVTVAAAQSGGGNQSGSGTQPGSGEDQSGNGGTQQGLPYYGFYSKQERASENYLSEVALTGEETDLTKIWFIGKDKLKTGENDTITVTAGNADITSTNVKVVDDYTLEITLPNGSFGSMYYIEVKRNTNNLNGIKVTSGNQPSQGDYAAYIDGYVIGFAEKRADGEVTKICESAANIFGHGTIENTSPDVPYQKEVDICIAAAKKSADTTGTVIYEVDSIVTDSVVIKRLWLETRSGDNTTYSWSGDGLVTELTSVGKDQPVPLYVKEGRNCEATVYAEIAITVGEQTYEQTIRMNIGLVIVDFSGLTRPDNDTVEQLNAFLAELAEQINTTDSKNEIYDIKLGSTTYEGTIHVPAAFKRYQASLHFIGTGKNGKQTVVKGGLDINGAFIEYIRDIHFVADESSASQTRAIFGGGLRDVKNCSFYGYDVALDSSEGLINASNSVFVNNEIAASVKINGSMNRDNILPSDWCNNTFVNNGTAVQVLSLNRQVSPYYFRIYDSNFINNGTDIDAQCGGTLYMYRNYFGQYKEVDGHRPYPGKHRADRHNGREHLRLDELLTARTESKLHDILVYTGVKINTENGTKVVTNPRWLHPVKDWWGHNTLVNDTFFGSEPASNALMTLNAEPEYKDVLVADWEDGTVILNEEANSLRLDASAFDGTAEKEIGVLDEKEEILGTWNFDGKEGA